MFACMSPPTRAAGCAYHIGTTKRPAASLAGENTDGEIVLDAGRSLLQYKSDYAGVWFDQVDERYSTQTRSCRNRRTGPRGREGRGIREWACPECGAYHHRDFNAAVNILAAGRRRLAEGPRPARCTAAEGQAQEGRQKCDERLTVSDRIRRVIYVVWTWVLRCR